MSSALAARSLGVLCRRPVRWAHTLSIGLRAEEVEALLRTKGGALAERRRTADTLRKSTAPWATGPHGEPEMSLEPDGSTPTQQWWTLSIPTSVEGEDAVIVSRVSSIYTPEVVGGATARPPTGLVQDLWVHEALPWEISAPLIRAAVDDLRVGGCEAVHALAPLPGLCSWIVQGQRWESLDPARPGYAEDQPGAVEACARGQPRPGHSVLGRGTFTAAQPAIEALALEFAGGPAASAAHPDPPLAVAASSPHSGAEEDRACDMPAAAFRAAGGAVTRVLFMHEPTAPKAVADSLGGCKAVIVF